MNIIERIIASKAGVDTVTVGQEVSVQVDLAIAHDVTAPIAISELRNAHIKKVYDPNKIAFMMDHNIPCSTVDSRVQHRTVNEFCQEYGTKLYNRSEGVLHQIAFEEGLYKKGDIIVGADSHTCTAGAFGAVAVPLGSTELAAVMALGQLDIEVPPVHVIAFEGELNPFVYGKDIILHIIGKYTTNGFTDKCAIFTGQAIFDLPYEEKMTMSNMMIEMGAMIGFIHDGQEPIGEVWKTDVIDTRDIVPCAACPSSPGNVKPISEIKGTRIDQAVLGSCTNGRYRDMEIAAKVLKGRKIANHVNMVVAPASRRILEQMEENGLTKIFRDAGAMVTNPGCGPCFGSHQGLLTEDDVCISSTNRNFPGRMGHKEASVYLASPRVVAESAVMGYIVEPNTVE